jgi:phosphoglycerol transferase MdoB-like AlkP superfamily enzyme
MPWNNLLRYASISVTLAILLWTSSIWMPLEAKHNREQFFADNNVTRHSPLMALYRVLLNREVINYNAKLTARDIALAASLGIEIKPDQPYPLIKEWIYKSPPPYQSHHISPVKPNIIVFFTEGFSARAIGSYGGKFAGLTPNIDAFATHPKTLQIENYFSHTAATYRGLHGQICSMFPKEGGTDGLDKAYERLLLNPNYCLSHYLNAEGYHTVFLDSHRKEAARVDDLMLRLSFAEVLTAEELAPRFLGNVEPLRADALSDQQFLRSLIGFLKSKEDTKQTQPWFIGLYNLETHALQDTGSDGIRYRDGSNNALNTIHNYDAAFGSFWHYFQNSPFASNTIIILTADHSRYPERSFAEAVAASDTTYQRIFFDRIPLIIYEPARSLPSSFDANYRSSIDFAPTLIHYLGLPNRRNPFLGTSLFDQLARTTPATAISSVNSNLYIADPTGTHAFSRPQNQTDRFKRINRIIHYVKSIEANNRTWSEQLTQNPSFQPAMPDDSHSY